MAAKAEKDPKTGKWLIQYRYTDWQGNRKKSTKRGFNTKREAEEWLQTFLVTQQADFNMMFEDFLKIYYADMETRLREHTMRTKKYIIDLKVLPFFGKMKMNEIKAADIRKWQNKLIQQGYAPTYLRTINNQVSALFNYAVMGISLWGYEVKKATVLYLALEDDNRRIQQRLYQMFGVQDVSDNLFFSTEKIALSGQLENEIELFLKEHRETGLIIIDTLQKVRGNESDTLSYAKDYDTVGKLKEIADRNDVCIMVVHHTRKQQSDDAFDMISGTNGLMGAADCSMILHKEKRTSNKAILDITGRDQTDQRIYLKRDEERLIWQFEKSESELWKEKPDPLLEVIADFINSNNGEWSGTPTELAKILAGDIQPNALSMMLNVRAGKLFEEYQICYEKGRNHSGRYIKLFLCEKKA